MRIAKLCANRSAATSSLTLGTTVNDRALRARTPDALGKRSSVRRDTPNLRGRFRELVYRH